MRDFRIRVGERTYYSGLDDLSKASDDERIRWFNNRFRKVIVRPLEAVKRIGPDVPAIWDLNLGVVTIICSAIEALGSFYTPGERDKIAFDRFVTKFMNPIYQQRSPATGRTYAEILYGLPLWTRTWFLNRGTRDRDQTWEIPRRRGRICEHRSLDAFQGLASGRGPLPSGGRHTQEHESAVHSTVRRSVRGAVQKDAVTVLV